MSVINHDYDYKIKHQKINRLLLTKKEKQRKYPILSDEIEYVELFYQFGQAINQTMQCRHHLTWQVLYINIEQKALMSFLCLL